VGDGLENRLERVKAGAVIHEESLVVTWVKNGDLFEGTVTCCTAVLPSSLACIHYHGP
jgi:hypothetical protein